MSIVQKLFSSKKAVVALAGIVIESLVATGVIHVDEGSREAFLQNIAIICGAYFVGQGAADWGKEAKDK